MFNNTERVTRHFYLYPTKTQEKEIRQRKLVITAVTESGGKA
jgi:hypothetical protein